MTEFGMSEIQSKAVLELRLQRLTGMEIEKIREEHAELMKTIADDCYLDRPYPLDALLVKDSE